jgi:hypothetical protein
MVHSIFGFCGGVTVALMNFSGRVFVGNPGQDGDGGDGFGRSDDCGGYVPCSAAGL